MAALDDAIRRSEVIAERIARRTDERLRSLIAEYDGGLSFEPLDKMMISESAWARVAAAGYAPQLVFAHPDMLQALPRSSEYYRGLALLPRKRVAALAVPVDRWESPQSSADVRPEAALRVARLYNAVISSLIEGAASWTLENGYRNIVANMGIGLDGTIRNLIGQDAEDLVKSRILDWLSVQGLIVQAARRGSEFRLRGGYAMRYGSEPDVEFRRSADGNAPVVATIEIKGGTDPAGALERLGAIQKSFEQTPPGCVNILIAGVITAEMEDRLNALGITKRYLLSDLERDGPEWIEFLNELFHHTVRITDMPISGPTRGQALEFRP